MPYATRLGDICSGHGCYPPRPSTSGSPDTFINGIPVVRLGDSYAPHGCPVCPPHGGSLSSGSSTCFVNGLPVGRIGDSISCGSTVATGCSDVMIGG